MVVGGDSCYKGCGFESQHHILDGHFPHLFVVKIVILFEKDEDNEKEAEDLKKTGLHFQCLKRPVCQQYNRCCHISHCHVGELEWELLLSAPALTFNFQATIFGVEIQICESHSIGHKACIGGYQSCHR